MSRWVIVSCLVSTWITFWQVDASHRDTRWPVVRYKLFRCLVARRITVRCVASRCLCAKLIIATCLVLAKCLFIDSSLPGPWLQDAWLLGMCLGGSTFLGAWMLWLLGRWLLPE